MTRASTPLGVYATPLGVYATPLGVYGNCESRIRCVHASQPTAGCNELPQYTQHWVLVACCRSSLSSTQPLSPGGPFQPTGYPSQLLWAWQHETPAKKCQSTSAYVTQCQSRHQVRGSRMHPTPLRQHQIRCQHLCWQSRNDWTI